jgi:type III secretion protein R
MDLTTFSPSSALLTIVVLALAPMVAVMVTSFTKLVVVLSLLRNALGLQQVPPNVVLNGLALVLSIFVMYPVGTEMAVRLQGIDNIGKDTNTMMAAADAAKLTERDFLVVVPAFTVTELSVAFEIGFLIFLPFLVIDLVISNILMAMGMMMLSPTTVSMPFKLLLFVLIDGWVKLTHGLILTYL